MGRGYVAVTSALISAASGDSSFNGTGLFSSFLANDWIAVSGSTKSGNNGLKQIATAGANKITLTTALTTESAGATITIARATHYDKVRAALSARLVAMTGVPSTIIYENSEGTTPSVGTAWLRTTLMPADAVRASMGSNGYSDTRGIWQVDVFVPPNQGPGYGDRLAGAIAAEFKTGTQMNAGGVYLTVFSSVRKPATSEEAWYHVPVQITWWTTTTEL